MISEHVFEDFLEDNLDLIEPGLKLIERQFKIFNHGKLDLFCEDKSGSLVIIELKTYASLVTINQIDRYKKAINETFPGRKAKFILVCLDKNKEIPRLCLENNIVFLQIKDNRIPTGNFSQFHWKQRQIIYHFLENNSFVAIYRNFLAYQFDMPIGEINKTIEKINKETSLNIISIPAALTKDIRYKLVL